MFSASLNPLKTKEIKRAKRKEMGRTQTKGSLTRLWHKCHSLNSLWSPHLTWKHFQQNVRRWALFFFPKTFLDRSQTYYSGTKKAKKDKRLTKKGSFIVIHWLVPNARERKGQTLIAADAPGEARVYVCIMAFVRAELNSLKAGLTQSIKLSKIVRENSKTIWPPNVRVLFVQRDTLVSVWPPAGGRGPLLCDSSHRGTRLICPQFSCFTLKMMASAPAEQKKAL